MTAHDVLFVHSLGGRKEFWDDVRAGLGTGVRTHAFDLRGHGTPRAPGTSFTLDDFVDDVMAAVSAASSAAASAAVPPAAGSGRFIFVGHSFGALVALAVAARAPERVAGLALIDAAGAMTAVPAAALEDFLAQAAGADGAAFIAEAYRQNLERATPATRERVLSSLANTDPAALIGAYTALFGSDPLALLARYPGPVRLIVDAANDSPMSLHAQHPDLDVVPVEGTSHWINLDQPAALVKALGLSPLATRPSPLASNTTDDS